MSDGRPRRGFRFGLAIVLAVVPVSASASDWWYVNSGPGRVVFVDARSIERSRDVVTYWTMHVIRPGEPEVMTKAHMRGQCGRRRVQTLEILRFDAKGRSIGVAPTQAARMQAVAPDTLGDAELRFACGDEGHRVVNDLFPMAVDEVEFAEALIVRGNKPGDAHGVHEAMVRKATASRPPLQQKAPEVVKMAPVSDEVIPATPDTASDHAAEIRQLEQACAGDTIASCADLGRRFADGLGVAKDGARATVFFDKACTGGDADSCTLLGIALHSGTGVPAAPVRAAAAFARACDLGGAADCGNLGLALVNGDGIAKDVGRAFGYFAAACDHGNAASCSSLGAAYSMGIGVKADARRAMRLFEKACDGDDAGGCYNLGVVYDQGLGVKKDPARAAALYVGACDRDDGAACGNLGTLVQSGGGIAQDVVRAGELFRKACDLQDADGCLNLGRAHQAGSGVTRDLTQAETYFRRALAIEPDKADARRALGALPSE